MKGALIVRYGEIWIKSQPVKRLFENALVRNIKAALNKNNVKYEKIVVWNSRIYIFGDIPKKLINCVKNVFGIVSFSPARVLKADIEELKKAALEEYKGGSFRITARRITKEFKFNSQQICQIVGEYVKLKTGAKVDLSNPDIDINIEINKGLAFVFTKYIKCFGGLPVGTEGKVVCVISNKNSVIAALQILRRGCEVYLLFTNKKIKQILKFLENYYPKDIPYSIGKIKDAEQIAQKIGAFGIVYGETDIKKIKKIRKGKVLLLFPCLGYDKKELNQLAKKYGVIV